MKYLCSAVFLLAFMQLRAQQKTHAEIPGKLAFRFNPMGLIDFLDGNLSVGLERPINQRLSLTTDVSVILYSAYIPENRRALGYIIKSAIRYYTSDERRLFFEAAVFYKRAGYKVTDWLGKNCVNGVPAYEKFETFIFRKRVLGLNAQAGWQRSLTRNNTLRMEIYVGVGVRVKWQDIKNDPMACYDANSLFDMELNQNNYTVPSLPHGLRLVYSIQ